MEDTTTEGVGTCCQTSLWHSARIHTVSSLVLILLAAFLFAQTLNALKEYKYIGGGIAPSNAITVAGTGEVFAVPDTAQFTFTVTKEGATAGEVQQAATAKANELVNALKGKGIEAADIKTVAYTVQPKYEWQPAVCSWPCERKQVQKGFELTQSVEVKVRALDKAGEILTLVTETGATSVSNLSFTIADEDAKRMEARKLAIDKARAKAEQLAGDLGVSLVRIIGFYEDNGQPLPYMSAVMDMKMANNIEQQAAQVPAGENQIISNVNISYEIR